MLNAIQEFEYLITIILRTFSLQVPLL